MQNPMTHLTEEDLVLIYYNEPGPDGPARRHLAGCLECRNAAQALATVLNSCNDWQAPEPGPELERSVWARLAPELVEPVRKYRQPWRWMAVACAVAAVLLLAFVAGRYSQRTRPSIMTGLSAKAQRRILAISLADHLDRAEMLMTEISDASGNEPVDRMRAQDLVDEGRLLRQTLARGGENSTVALLDQVERFMLEVSNAPDRADPQLMRELRERIAADSLLFKVRIIESNLRTEGQRI
jgi:hypothetical protein